MTDESYSLGELAELLGVGRKLLLSHIEADRLGAFQQDEDWIITAAALQACVEANRYPADPSKWVRRGSLRGAAHPMWRHGLHRYSRRSELLSPEEHA